MADEAQVQTEVLAEARFVRAADCDLPTLRKILIQYRFFTLYYIGDLAYLIAMLPFGKLRSFMAHILDEELGNGDETAAHPELYDSFLRSIGVANHELEDGIAKNMSMLEEIRHAMVREPYPYGIGLRGMGGECMCQIYLAKLYGHFMKNPYIQQLKDTVDWRFWDIHIGPVDVHHREETRALLNKLVLGQPELGRQINAGFQASIRTWDLFWANIIEGATSVPVETRRYERRAATRRANVTGELVASLRTQFDSGYFRAADGTAQPLARGTDAGIPTVTRSIDDPPTQPVTRSASGATEG
jgi:hypothetical protein